MMQRRQVLAWGCASALGLLGSGTAQAQAYPGGPITLVLPLQAGTASDVAVRHMADRLGQRMAGNSFVVENVAAAAGLVGLERLSRVRPDGRTVAALNNSIMTILPHLQARNIRSALPRCAMHFLHFRKTSAKRCISWPSKGFPIRKPPMRCLFPSAR